MNKPISRTVEELERALDGQPLSRAASSVPPGGAPNLLGSPNVTGTPLRPLDISGTPILPATPTPSLATPNMLGTPIFLEAPTLLGTPSTPGACDTSTSVKRLGVLLARDLPCMGASSEAGCALVDPDPA
jgi:hypothetical protein